MADHMHWATFLICTFVSFVCDCKPLDRYKFPVNTTVSCPRNQTECNERSSAINCTQGNGFLCLPNEELTELLEFCYFDHRILIEKGTCMYLRNRDSFLDDYDCRNFVDGCPNTTYRINEIYKYESCLSIGNGCFLADPTCVSTTATYSISENSSTTTSEDTTQKTNYERNNLVWIATLLGAITLICIPVVMCFLKIKGTLHLTPADASTKLETNQTADEEENLLVSDKENDITKKKTCRQTDKAPVQEVGEHIQAQTHALSGFSATTLPSRLGAYDRGKNAGICIILNNETFANANTHPTRNGTNKDRDLLEYSFKFFRFDVRVYNNTTCQEITQLLGEIQQIDHKDNGALVVCTLSHGDLNVVSGACGQDLQINSMTSLFRADNCPSLAGKPKFFIFQACQGKDTQYVWHQTYAPVMAESDTNLVPNMAEVITEVPHLHLAPAEADFLIAHSTMPGYVSFRNDKGSFFVQSLVKLLKEHSPREDVISILVEVNRDVSQTIGKTSGGQIAAQIPEPKVRLTKKFYLYPVETE